MRKILSKLFKLSDYIITSTSGHLFCFLFNIRAYLINSQVTIKWSKGFYQAIDKNDPSIQRYFRAERQGNMAYRKGFQSRVRDLSNSYFFNLIDFMDGDTVVDCGANVGDVELIFRNKIAVNYVAFEPSPDEFACLSKNIGQHVAENIGLWHEEGVIDFYVASQGADSSLIEPSRYEKKITVQARPLSQYISEPVKCLKLEAEGAEPEILVGLGDKVKLIEYVTVDVGFERGLKQESTLCAVSNILLKNNFKMVALGKQRLCVLYKNERYE